VRLVGGGAGQGREVTRPTVAAGSDAVQDGAERAADSDAADRASTVGFVAKGFLYIVVAAIAGSVGFGGGGEASQTGAISQLSDEPYGTVLLVVLAVGLACHAAMRLLHVVINPSGEDGAKGVLMRASYLGRALLYGGLCVYTVGELVGGGGGGGGGEQEVTQTLLELPAGRLLVGAIALILLGVGIHQVQLAWTASFMDQVHDADARQRRFAEITGRVGHAARGLVFGTMGVLFGRAALESDASEAGGVDEALQAIASSPVGTGALALAAIGLAAFGVYCWALAAWSSARRAG
jgi:hypothetical protein